MAEALARREPSRERLAQLIEAGYITIDEAHRAEARALLNGARVDMSRAFADAKKSSDGKRRYCEAAQRYSGILDVLRIFAPDIVQAAEENFFKGVTVWG